MKKLILLGTLLAMVNVSMAKEIVPKVEAIQEEIEEVEKIDEAIDESIPPLNLELEKTDEEKEIVKGEAIYNIYGRIGGDIASKYDLIKNDKNSLNKRETNTFGYELGVENTIEVAENFEVGIGLLYQNHGKSKEKTYKNKGNEFKTKIENYDSLPVYIVTKYNLPMLGSVKPYLKANLGYSFNFANGDSKIADEIKLDTKISNGLYYGVGLGAEYKNFFVDMIYQMNEAKLKIKNVEINSKKEYDYSRVTFGFGYKFNF